MFITFLHYFPSRFLLDHGAKVDHSCNQGATALSISSQEGHIAGVKLLLDRGADPSHSDSCGRSALRMAVKGGHVEVARMLEERLGGPEAAKAKGGSANSSLAEISQGVKPPNSLELGGERGREDDGSPDSTCELPNHQKRRLIIFFVCLVV